MTDKAYQVIDGVEGVHVSTQNCVVHPEIYILSLGEKKKKREGGQPNGSFNYFFKKSRLKMQKSLKKCVVIFDIANVIVKVILHIRSTDVFKIINVIFKCYFLCQLGIYKV